MPFSAPTSVQFYMPANTKLGWVLRGYTDGTGRVARAECVGMHDVFVDACEWTEDCRSDASHCIRVESDPRPEDWGPPVSYAAALGVSRASREYIS